MKKILFIATFNDGVKELHELLMNYFQVQICETNRDVVNSMMKVYQPDLLFISLVDFNQEDKIIFDELVKRHSDIPIVTIGSRFETSVVAKYEELNITKLLKPVDNKRILESIYSNLISDANSVVLEQTKDERKHIMFVDDNPVLLRTMKNMIKDRYKVTMATSGVQAMTLIGKNKPDLIFLDYEMPICDGKQTLEMIRSEPSVADIPVVFLTAMAERKYIESIISLKPVAYILKPPSPKKIEEIIKQVLD